MITEAPEQAVRVAPDQSPEDSHRFEYVGRHAIVYGVPLFTEMKSDKAERNHDRESLAEIVRVTNEKMDEGRFPKIVIGHSEEERERPSVGFVRGPLWLGEVKNGRAAIFGDLVVNARTFESQILTNQYPSRSIEVVTRGNDTTPQGYVAAVALLGSSLPQADVPDLVFHSAGDVETGSQFPSSATNGSAREKRKMKLADFIKMYEEGSDEDKAKMKKMMAQSVKAEGKEEKPKTEENSTEEAETEKNSAAVETNGGADSVKVAEMSAQMATMHAQMGALKAKLDESEIRSQLSSLASEGVIMDIDSETSAILSLNSSEARTAQIEKIRTNYKRDEAAAVLAGSASLSRMGATETQTEKFTAEDSDKVQRRSAQLMRENPGMESDTAYFKAAKELGITIPGVG